MGKKPLNENQVKSLRMLVKDKPLHDLLLNLSVDLMLRSSDLLSLRVKDIIQRWWLEILSNEDFTVGGKILNFDENNRAAKSDLLYSFNEHTKAYKPNHRNWEARRLCSQFKKLVPFAMDKRRGSGPREYEFPSLNECKLYFAEMYSLDTEIFEIS